MQDLFRWGIIGPGVIARRFAAALRSISPFCCYAAASRDAARAAEFAGQLGFQTSYGSYEALLRDDLVDIVYIAVPHSHHYDCIKLALSLGKHVVCEKPMTANERQAKELFALAEREDLFLMEGIWTRFLPAVKRAVELVGEGAIGSPRYLRCQLGYNQPFEPEGRLFNPALAGGALLDLGIYPLTMMLLLLGDDFASVQSHLYFGQTGVDEVDAMTYLYPDGRLAQLACSITCDIDDTLTLFGTKGKLSLPRFASTERVLLEATDGALVAEDYPHRCNGFEYQAAAVMQALAEGRRETAEVKKQDTLLTMRMMDLLRSREAFSYPFESR